MKWLYNCTQIDKLLVFYEADHFSGPFVFIGCHCDIYFKTSEAHYQGFVTGIIDVANVTMSYHDTFLYFL